MHCPNCGREIPDGPEFRPYCRAKVESDKTGKSGRKGGGSALIFIIIAVVIAAGLFAYFKLSPVNKNVEELILSKNVSLDTATKIAEKQVARNPKDVNKRIELSNCYTLTNNFGKAEKQFQKVLQIEPDNEYAKDMLKLIKFIRGEE